MIYEYKLIVNNSIYNLGSIGDNALNLINGANTTIKKPLCSTQYKSVAGELTIKLESSRNTEGYRQVLQAILDARDNTNKFDILLEVKRGSTTVFNGYIDDTNFNITTKVLPQNLTLAARDKTVLLDEQIKYNQYLEGLNRTNLVSWLLGKLQTQTGIVIPTLLSSDLTDNGTDSTISNWVITEEDNKTYRQWIDTILYEAPGCVLWYDCANNGYRIKQLPLSAPSEDDTTIRDVHYLIASNIQTTNGVYANDGVLVSYPTVSSRENQNVYNENISRSIDEDTGKLIGTEVPVGEYMPEDGDIVATYQEFSAEGLDRAYITKESRLKNDDIALMYVKNPTYDVASDPSGAMTVETTPIADIGYEGIVSYYPRKAWILLKNTSQQIANVTLFSIKGTAIYKSKMNKMTVPLACAKPEEYETQTLFSGSEQQVQSFASWLLNAKKYSCTTSTWEESEDRVSEDNPYSQLGDIVRVPHRIDDIHTIKIPHIVVQVEDMAHTTYGRVRKQKVTAISLSGYSVYNTVRKEVIKPSAITDDSNTIIKIVQYFGISSSTSVEPTTWTTSRASLTPTATDKYIWSYSVYTYLNGSTSESSKSIIEVYQDVDVQFYNLIVSPNTYYKDLRDSISINTINVSLDVKGYQGEITAQYSIDNGANWIDISLTDNEGSFTIPYLNEYTSVLVRSLLNNVEMKRAKLNLSDITGLPIFLGIQTSDIPTLTPDGQLLINGDYFAVGSEDIIEGGITYPAGSTWKKESASWVLEKNPNNLLISLNALVKDETIDLRAISNANTVSFFRTIIGEEAIFESIFGNNIKVGNSIYGGDVNTSSWDINEGGKGFILLADGKLKAKQAELEDITVSGESELTDVTINGNSEFNGKGVFRGKISATALETFDSSPEISFYSLSTSKSPVAGVTYYSDRNGTVYTGTVTNPKEQGLYINSIDSSKCTKQQWENIEGILEDTQYSDKTKLSKVYANSALYHNGVWIEVGSKAALNWDGVISRSTNGIDFEVVMEIKGSITNSQIFHSVGVLNNTMFALQKMTHVYISNDNGITWSKASDLPYEVPAFGAATVINGAVYVACSNKCVYKTTDFSSWQQVNVFDSYPLRVGYNGSEFVVIMSNGNIHFYNDLSSTPTFISYSEPPEGTVSLTYSFLYGDKFVIPTTKQYFIGHEKYEFDYASAMSSAEYHGKLYFSTGVSLFEASNDLQSIKVVNSGFIGNGYRAVVTDGNKLVWPSNVNNNGIFIIEPKWKCKPIIEFLNSIKQKLSEDYIKSLPEGITFEDFSEPLQYETPCTGILHYDNRQYNFSEAFCDGQQLTVYGSSFGEFTIKTSSFSGIKCYLENLIILEIEENVVTKTIIPKVKDFYDIGTPEKKFNEIYANNGYFNTLNANINSAGTSNLVYGAVFN